MISHDELIIKLSFSLLLLFTFIGSIIYILMTRIKKLKETLKDERLEMKIIKLENEALQKQRQDIQQNNSKKFNYLNAIFTSVKDGIILLDNWEKVILMNPQAQDIFSVDNQVFFNHEVIENHLLYHKINATIKKVKVGGKSTTKILDFEDSFYEIFVSEIFDKYSKNQPLGVLISIRDVTEQFRIEELRQNFVQNVSHEFRTPLTIISSYIETLKMWDDIENDYKDEAFKIIEFEIHRLQKILDQLLQITSLDHKEECEMVSISLLIKDILPSYSRIAEEKNMRIEFVDSLQDKDDLIYVNKSLFLQAISNILENAIKYTFANSKIIIELNSNLESAYISVKDEGPGIPVEDQSKIFERFYRVDKHRNSKTGGSGLGLAISKEIVESFNGQIKIKSRPNQGSVFIITMPKIKEERT